MPDRYEDYRPPRRRHRRRRRWSAKRWRFELIRVGVLLVLIALLVLLVQGCRAVVGLIAGDGGEDAAPSQSDTAESSGGETAGEEDAPAGTEDAAAQETEAEPQAEEVTLVMVGDVLLHTPLQDSGLQADGSYNYDHFFAHTRDLISAADLALVNQEVILGGTELGLSGYPAFNGAFEVGDALVNAGFDVVCHATNHALDKGEEGLLNCLNFWQTEHPDIGVLGIHASQADQDEIYLYEENGITIALLNYTYGTNGIALPQPYEVDLLEEDRVIADLERADELADFVVVAPHWGTEYTHTPSQEQEDWAELFLAHGADLVLGTHPHVIQPVEWLEDESGNRMLVYYSLGNFINFTSDSGSGVAQRALGAMAQVTLTRGEDGEVSISDYGVVPLVAHMVEGTGNPTVYPLSDYTEELAAQNAMSEKDSAFSLAYCQELSEEVFGELWGAE